MDDNKGKFNLLNTIRGIFKTNAVDSHKLMQDQVGVTSHGPEAVWEPSRQKTLKDLLLVETKIKECFNAFFINSSVSSSVMLLISYVMGDIIVTAEEGEDDNEDATKIKKLLDDLDLNKYIVDIVFNLLITGKSFTHILKNVNGEIVGLDTLYDWDDRNRFIEIKDPYGELLGYKARVELFKPSKTWKSLSYDDYLTQEKYYETVNYDVDEVLYVELLNNMNLSLVSLTLDDVYLHKMMLNDIPEIIRRQYKDVFVAAGTDEHPFSPYNVGDSPEHKYEKKRDALKKIKNDYKAWLGNKQDQDNNVIVHDYLFKPRFLDNTNFNISNWVELMNMLKQDIKEKMISPAGMFDNTTMSNTSTQINDVFSPLVDLIRTKIIDSISTNILPKIVSNPDDFTLEFNNNNINEEQKLMEIYERLERIAPASNVDDLKVRQKLFIPRYAEASKGVKKEIVPSQYNAGMFDTGDDTGGDNSKEINNNKPNSTQSVNIGTEGISERSTGDRTKNSQRKGIK
jgi:hypothetical protein